MGVIRVRVRNYTEVVDRILNAVEKSDQLTVWYQSFTAPFSKEQGESSYPVYCLRYTSTEPDAPLIYISAGIHGDELAGVECAIRLIELLSDGTHCKYSVFPFDRYNWLISPCDNPHGYEHNIRENPDGQDLNRMFGAPNRYPVTAFIAETLLQTQSQHSNNNVGNKATIELSLDLHEDIDSYGFYLWERRTSTCVPIGDIVVQTVAGICPINKVKMVEEHRNENGVITLLDNVTTKGWTRGRYLSEKLNARCLILETPTHLDLQTRISVHMMAIQTAVKHTFISGDHKNC